MTELKPCPFCGGTNSEEIAAVGGEYVGLIFVRHGSVRPKVCLDCGIVYVSKDVCERIMKGRKQDGK